MGHIVKAFYLGPTLIQQALLLNILKLMSLAFITFQQQVILEI
jgi:hypothetical protein